MSVKQVDHQGRIYAVDVWDFLTSSEKLQATKNDYYIEWVPGVPLNYAHSTGHTRDIFEFRPVSRYNEHYPLEDDDGYVIPGHEVILDIESYRWQPGLPQHPRDEEVA